MAIDPSALSLRMSDFSMALSPARGRSYMHLEYQVFHAATGAVVTENTLAAPIANTGEITTVDQQLIARALAEFDQAKWQHQPIAAIGNRSAYDAGHILEHWQIESSGANQWKFTHPISGTYDDIPIVANPFPDIVQRVNVILGLVLPPPIWGFASSPAPGQLSASCVAVSGAASYKVYNDHGDGTFTLLGNAPTAAGGTIAVSAGYYRVRMAAVGGNGRIGCMGRMVSVTVEEVTAQVQMQTVPAEIGGGWLSRYNNGGRLPWQN